MLKGHLDMLVLAGVRAGAPHGYTLIRTLRERSAGAFDLAEGTVYPVLRRLEHRGLLKSRWTDVSGRRRRVYRLTPAGRREFERREAIWERFSGAVDAVLVGGT